MALRFRPAGRVNAAAGHRFDEETLAAVARSAARRGEVGHADFHFDTDYRTRNGRVSRLDLIVTLTIEMPTWSEYPNRPQSEKDEWDRFHSALRHHEDGHIAIFRREARTTYRRLRRETDPDRVHSVLDDETARVQGLSDDYDVDTDHGRTQNTPSGTTVIQVP